MPTLIKHNSTRSKIKDFRLARFDPHPTSNTTSISDLLVVILVEHTLFLDLGEGKFLL